MLVVSLADKEVALLSADILSAIQFVMVDGLERPTPENSRPMRAGDEAGRGSLVFFNQATMYQTSETGHATLHDAVEAGHSGKVDYGLSAQEAFTRYAKYLPVGQAPCP
jgi:hypothetical protein